MGHSHFFFKILRSKICHIVHFSELVVCKDVGIYSTRQRHRLPMGTLVWKVSQIL